MSKKKPEKKTLRKTPANAGGPMDVDLLQQIVSLMSTNDLNTVDVRDGEKRIVLKRGALAAPSPGAGTNYQTSPIAQETRGLAPAAASDPSAPSPDENAGTVPIKSPMVGTFYTASSPDAKAFVSVGSVVDEETDVCIIEAMKVFNNIKAECRGTITKVLVANGETVEFGQALFLVKP